MIRFPRWVVVSVPRSEVCAVMEFGIDALFLPFGIGINEPLIFSICHLVCIIDVEGIYVGLIGWTFIRSPISKAPAGINTIPATSVFEAIF